MTPVDITAMKALRATMRLQTNIVGLVEQQTNISPLNAEITLEHMQQDIDALQALVNTLRQQS